MARPDVGIARAAAVLARGRRAARTVLRFLLDVLTCLGSMLQPTFWSGVAMSVAVALGQAFVAMGDVAFGGFVVGTLSVCVVAGVLVWAEHRHHWWTRRELVARPRAGDGR